MSWEPCRNCGELRKWGVVVSNDGFHVPECVHCGDPSYWEPHDEDE